MNHPEAEQYDAAAAELERAAGGIPIETRKRITICDGYVVTFATSFVEKQGIFGPMHDALGPFEVSASRNSVYVHRAECVNDEQVQALQRALGEASKVAREMADNDSGNYGRRR